MKTEDLILNIQESPNIADDQISLNITLLVYILNLGVISAEQPVYREYKKYQSLSIT